MSLAVLRENLGAAAAYKSKAKKTPLQMLLRGQNSSGIAIMPTMGRPIRALAVENGMDIFRFRRAQRYPNIEAAIKAVKKHGATRKAPSVIR